MAGRHHLRPALDRLDDRTLPTGVPVLNSLPGAGHTLFLDFDGNVQPDLSYEDLAGVRRTRTVTSPAFDLDGNPADFNPAEVAAIKDVFQRVAEDYLPFNVNVTTVDPGGYPDGVAFHIVVGGSHRDWYAPDLPVGGAPTGFCPEIGSFTESGFPNVCFVWPADVGNDLARIGNLISHEAGHGFGLRHQSLYDAAGNLITPYNPGTADRLPIMGPSGGAARSTWYYGPTDLGPNDIQDDLAVLYGVLGYRPDDYDTDSPPALDTTGNRFLIYGRISRPTDVDAFTVTTAGGRLTVNVGVAGVSPNLDARVQLLAPDGSVVAAADPPDALAASVTALVPAGTYQIRVLSHGGYADLGEYSVSGTVNGPADPQEAWVASLYRDALRRIASDAELAGWVGRLRAGASFAQVAAAIEGSAERQSLRVRDFYAAHLGRAADAGGVATWLGALAAGGTLHDVEAAIVGSQEFYQRAGATPDGCVRAVYREVLSREASADEVAYWRPQATAARAAVARAIVGSLEHTRTAVAGLYTAFLRRPADEPAWSVWAGLLQRTGSEPSVLGPILASVEYQQLAVRLF
jgi:hypothetical protein